MANYITRSLKQILLFLLLLLPALRSLAALEPYQNRKTGTLKKGDVLVVKDEKFRNKAYKWDLIRNRSVENIITFGLNRDTTLVFPKSFSCEIELKVEYWSQPDQKKPLTIENVKLKINYDTTYGAVYQGEDTYRFKNAHLCKITVTNITSNELGANLPPMFMLSGKIFVDRKYLPAENEAAPVMKVSVAAAATRQVAGRAAMGTMNIEGDEAEAHEVIIQWDQEAAEEYDLEWTFIDEKSANGAAIEAASLNPSVGDLALMMKNNATRVTTSRNMYRLSLVNNHKYLLVRWRRVTYDDDDDFRREEAWIYATKQVTADGETPHNGLIVLEQAQHHPHLNWQYNVTYAEEGKKKEVVSYFDGSLRNRQTVTVARPDELTAAEDYAVVQQNVYDQFGRVAANVLPAPVKDNALKFYGNINQKADGEYRFTDLYKGNYANCLVTPTPMASLSGAAKYYSANNDFSGVNRDYIPAAEGYPFSMVSYTPDNTGRIVVQGGVGLHMQPGTNALLDHTTRFYYSKPHKGELERLFGSDVGVATHYLKKVAVDPNKQISISYENASGKVIATALAGTPPTTVDALLSSAHGAERTMIVLSPDEMVLDRQSLTLRGYTTYVNTLTGPATLRYEVEKLIKQYEEKGVSICSNCYYAMRIKLSDDCGQPLAEVTAPVKIGSATSDCSATGTQAADISFSFARIGTNYITFELAMDPDVIKHYTDDYVARNTNLRSKFDFVVEALQQTDFSGCFTECTTCEKNLGSREYFLEQLAKQLEKYDVDPYKMGAVYDTWANGLYTQLLSQCKDAQQNCAEPPCKALRTAMEADVSPGGQYALFTTGANGFVVVEPEINVLALYWRIKFPVLDRNSATYKDHLLTLPNGGTTSLNDELFTLQMLVENWKPEWAATFVNQHPEYCALDLCEGQADYIAWDNRLKEVYNSTADIARIKPGLTYDRTRPQWLLNADPFFGGDGPGSEYYGAMLAALDKYSLEVLKVTDSRVPVKSLSEYVDFALYCGDKFGNTSPATDDRWSECQPVDACRVPDQEWRMYRDLYLQQKDVYYKLIQDRICLGKCKVGEANGSSSSVPFCTQISTASFSYSMQFGNVLVANYIGPVIPVGVTILASFDDPFNGNEHIGTAEFNSANYDDSQSFVYSQSNLWSVQLTYSCTGTPTSGCPAAYLTKTPRRTPARSATTDLATATAAHNTGLLSAVTTACEAQADIWIAALEPCLASNPAYESKRALLKQRLIDLCVMGGDVDHPNGASSLKPGQVTAQNTRNFGEVIKNVLGIAAFDMVCNPWLLEAPYPYNAKPQVAELDLIATDPKLCAKLAELQNTHMNTNPGITFYQFLAQKYGQLLKLTASEVTMLENGCTNCRYLLAQPMTRPLFLDPDSPGCINAATFNQAWQQMLSEAVTEDTHENFPVIASTYLNHRWGFTLSFDDYKAYRDKVQANNNATEMLCNIPSFENVDIDPYGCLADQMAGAVKGGLRNYAYYIEEVKKEFRSAYVNYCGNNQALVKLKAEDNVYHYTLYYYDQAGNLVRTIPPEGVQLLDDAQANQAAKGRDLPNSPCNYNGPTANTDKAESMTKLAQSITGGVTSIECWLNGDFGAAKQVMFNANKQYLLNMCVDGRYLHVDVYTVHKLPNGTIGFSNSNHVVADIATALPLRDWVHVVVEGNNLAKNTFSVYVNGKECPIAARPPKATCGWQLDIDDTVEKLPEELSLLKHLRLYNRKLSLEEVSANAAEICMGISPLYYESLAVGAGAPLKNWGRFNITSGSGGSGGTTEITERQSPLIYPNHRLATSYAYSSLGQVVQQETPDAGISKFWYDKLGRLFASQNAEQLSPAGGGVANRYSYTNNDAQGRIIEVGEKLNYTPLLSETGFVARGTVETFLNTTTGNTQITHTKYDEEAAAVSSFQRNLRKRVSATTYKENSSALVTQATYYSYDQLGNVNSLWQQIDGMPLKRIDYKFDLASGKVNAVRLAPGSNASAENFYYSYEYDGENRVVLAKTGIGVVSVDGWEPALTKNEASYAYYPHGALSRTKLGNQHIQGIDYAYTIHGWIKGVNGNYLSEDMGKDGVAGEPTATIGKDVMAYSLDYFKDDYTSIGTNNAFKLQPGTDSRNLFNGNITRSTVALKNINSDLAAGYSYKYDQLNRLTTMRHHPLTNNGTAWGTMDDAYKEDISYDANGNILSYDRNRGGGVAMDKLQYHYNRENGFLKNNRLDYVNDAVAAGINIDDIKDLDGQSNYTYLYDKIGNLISERDIDAITWTVYGKIRSITMTDGSSLEYKYDASGNRVSKTSTKAGVVKTTWYLRDAQGNVLSVYDKTGAGNIIWREQHLYGSSRVGVWEPSADAGSASFMLPWNGSGTRSYELTNHLGNVLATVSDVGLLKSSTDYYPFGMMKPERSWRADLSRYRYGFNGKENDNEVKGEGNQQDYGMRIYNARLGKFLSVDPITNHYPELTPYQFASNTPLQGIDLDGMELLKVNSSAYRMKYLASIPIITATSAKMVAVNTVVTIPENLPKGYKDIEMDGRVYVGAKGHNMILEHQTRFLAVGPTAYAGDDDGETVQKTPTVKSRKVARFAQNASNQLVVGQKTPDKFNKAASKATAIQDLWNLGKGFYDGVKSFNETLILSQEEPLRKAFYRATNIVDETFSVKENSAYLSDMSKVAEIGAFRADLINYLTDGTMPADFKGDKDKKGYYNSEVLKVGDQLMKEYGIEKRSKTK
ncbi:RHS repeat-associated core domain-containing protein [uncultured Chitinophaga sp.]|uniref:RHS repeat-associated core domain-containing protein n=1 Tax=uncultured Chitinophaga sp. TaxID=339340 RepID=UPI0025F1E78E|nr:RHS repeat-associated core domain-containing protein [uncultured Chitinophaga sp.]